MHEMLPLLKVVVGPTASGKSSYAIELAKECDGEVVNADSRQLYREVSIGVAKPVFDFVEHDVGYVDGIPHHLFFALSPAERANVVAYQAWAFEVIDDIVSRGKIPILVGGTGYYVQAVVDNMQYPEGGAAHEIEQLSQCSLEDMCCELERLDKNVFERIDTANPRRVINALARVRLGLPDVVAGKSLYNVQMFGMTVSFSELEERIRMRVDQMLSAGLVDEVALIVRMYGNSAPVLDSIGYKEVALHLRGEVSREEMRELIVVHTRQYARRQMQWLKRDSRIIWL